MITLYTADTPNGLKITIALQELELACELRLLDLQAGPQYQPDFAALSPNKKIPLLVDDGQAMFESGAILVHLAEKAGRLLPKAGAERSTVLQWLFLQMASVGPMMGQLWWFRQASTTGPRNEQALERYGNEVNRLYGVYEQHLASHSWLGGDNYSIADIATWPWLNAHAGLGVDMTPFPAVSAWLERIAQRPATVRGMAQAKGT